MFFFILINRQVGGCTNDRMLFILPVNATLAGGKGKMIFHFALETTLVDVISRQFDVFVIQKNKTTLRAINPDHPVNLGYPDSDNKSTVEQGVYDGSDRVSHPGNLVVWVFNQDVFWFCLFYGKKVQFLLWLRINLINIERSCCLSQEWIARQKKKLFEIRCSQFQELTTYNSI